MTAAEWDKASKDLDTLHYVTVGKVGGAPVGFIRKCKSQALTCGDRQRVWLTLMDKYYESGEILRTAMSNFKSLKLEDGETERLSLIVHTKMRFFP